MNIRRMLLVIATVAVSSLSACGTDGSETAADGATSVVDPATGEPVATNYPTDAKFVDVSMETASSPLVSRICPVDDPFCVPRECFPWDPDCICDPVNDFGCEPCDPTNELAWCYEPPPPPPCTAADGLISQYRVQRTGREASEQAEVTIFGGSRCNRFVVTGIGGAIVSDSNYETLHIEYRQLYADGTMGPRTIHRTGSNPNRIPEAWVQAPDGYAIVGVAAGQQSSHDLKTLIGYSRQVVVTSAGVRMSGPYQPIHGGVNPYGTLDSLAVNQTPNDNEVFVGLGLRSAVQQTKTLVAFIGTLP
ncbi:hypothetical protein [Pyxidicoccus trucidator]|uniref:hypothetical protein n=1 Tax=Pyxidicoccus trucidator TaxID=2709662 RepID=UPI0013DC56ED|nr:hypothetical protein [Pyxidicoccus trucidator]